MSNSNDDASGSGNKQVNVGKRRFLVAATSVVGAAGAVALVVPFLKAWAPSERAKAAGAPVEADISKLMPGQKINVEWRGKPVWIVRRTEEMLADLNTSDHVDRLADPDSAAPQQPDYCQNETRSLKPEYLVTVGICTHLGCSPAYRPEKAPEDLGAHWTGGFFCACHGSTFDLAARVYKNKPAPTNLVVPDHHYLTDNTILIGESGGNA